MRFCYISSSCSLFFKQPLERSRKSYRDWMRWQQKVWQCVMNLSPPITLILFLSKLNTTLTHSLLSFIINNVFCWFLGSAVISESTVSCCLKLFLLPFQSFTSWWWSAKCNLTKAWFQYVYFVAVPLNIEPPHHLVTNTLVPPGDSWCIARKCCEKFSTSVWQGLLVHLKCQSTLSLIRLK